MNEVIKNQLISYFQSRDTIKAVFVYGSFASGGVKKSSDIDVAILTEEDDIITFMDKSRMSLELEEITNRTIDLVSLNKVSSILQMQVLKKGKLLFCSDKALLTQFQVRVVREYIDLKRIRKPIEDQLKNVSVYG